MAVLRRAEMQNALRGDRNITLNRLGGFGGVYSPGPERAEVARWSGSSRFTLLKSDVDCGCSLVFQRKGSLRGNLTARADDDSAVAVFESDENRTRDVRALIKFERQPASGENSSPRFQGWNRHPLELIRRVCLG